jgi:hypothetical protein
LLHKLFGSYHLFVDLSNKNSQQTMSDKSPSFGDHSAEDDQKSLVSISDSESGGRDLSSSTGGQSSTNRSYSNTSTGDDDHSAFAKNESRRVRNSKILVLTILFLVALAVCLAVYFITSNGEDAEFNGA